MVKSLTYGRVNFTTILLPGLMASMIIMQGMFGITMPLVMEFSWQRTIEDRALAPVPIRVLGIQKITAGAIRAFICAPIVLPVALFVHAAGQGPHIHVANWLVLVLVMIGSSTVTAAMGLLLGTMMDPRKTQMIIAVVLMPITMLGCVYYPWSALHAIRWLQTLVLLNPVVYMSEGLRAALTPSVAHMPVWAVLLALFGGTLVFGYLGPAQLPQPRHQLSPPVRAGRPAGLRSHRGQRPEGWVAAFMADGTFMTSPS